MPRGTYRAQNMIIVPYTCLDLGMNKCGRLCILPVVYIHAYDHTHSHSHEHPLPTTNDTWLDAHCKNNPNMHKSRNRIFFERFKRTLTY